MRQLNIIKSVLFGVALGDAIGVPVEFMGREEIRRNPVTDMIGFGTYQQPAGTFSDDTSLTLCLAEALTEKFDCDIIALYFVKWFYENYWTARGNVFDIGGTTRVAIERFASGTDVQKSGCYDIYSNGNGSLMRIAPLLFYINNKPILERFEITKQVSAITHGHIRSVMACFYYLEFARYLSLGKDKFEIYKKLQDEITSFFNSLSINQSEISLFHRLLKQNIDQLKEEEINSSGYVIDTLEASIWCLLTTNDYESAILKAVNLGRDTDTTGAVTGGLAGLLYGYESFPKRWLEQLARRDDIEDLAKRLERTVGYKI